MARNFTPAKRARIMKRKPLCNTIEMIDMTTRDRWGWMLGEDNDFKVKELSRFAEEKILQVKSGAAGYRQVKVLEFFDCPGPRQGVEDLKELLHKHGGSKQVGFKQLGVKQVGFKQLGPSVETGVHEVHDEKRVWFEVELQGAQGDREAEVFQVSNDDTAVAQRRLEDKQPEENNTDCLVKEQEKEYQTGWKIKTGNVLDSCNQRSTQQCMKSGVAKHLGVTKIQQPNGLVDETNVTLFAKVRCFLIQSGLSKIFWAGDTTRNMGFNKSGEYKKTFIGSGVGTGLMQVLHGFEFEVKPLGDHTFEVEPQENIDQRAGLQEVQTQDLMDYQLAHDREQHLACELFGYREDSNGATFAVSVVEKTYAHESLTFNNTVASTVTGNAVTTSMAITGAEIWATKGLLAKAKGNILSMEIVRDHSGNTLRVSQSRFYNRKLVQTLLEGHSILLLEVSLSGDCDVEKNESRYELRLVAGIATGALVKGGFRYEGDDADRWSWTLCVHDEFSVKSVREAIDQQVLITSSTPSRWSKVIPIKLNIFMWHMLLDKLPTRSNLVNRGLDVPCSPLVESSNSYFARSFGLVVVVFQP
uniref:Zinc finger, CCHC-type n=1 Tax=Tanacetum cinerariifolium TaxID=118510 RepID=A0A699GJQ6_TANCI|nr:zinc finger, CCHC-type [Tanacetum cinerariifolium]